MKNRGLIAFLRDWVRDNPHVWWALALIPIFICYGLPEHLVVNNYHPTEIAFDSLIPFLPGFVWFYLLWFPLLVYGGMWMLVFDGSVFRSYMLYLLCAYLLCAAIYLLYPNGQNLRPEPMTVYDRNTVVMAFIYSLDTNTNVLPSLHVIGSMGAAFGLCSSARNHSVAAKLAVAVLALLVSISTVFVKQHGIVDVLAGFAVGMVLSPIILCRKNKK